MQFSSWWTALQKWRISYQPFRTNQHKPQPCDFDDTSGDYTDSPPTPYPIGEFSSRRHSPEDYMNTSESNPGFSQRTTRRRTARRNELKPYSKRTSGSTSTIGKTTGKTGWTQPNSHTTITDRQAPGSPRSTLTTDTIPSLPPYQPPSNPHQQQPSTPNSSNRSMRSAERPLGLRKPSSGSTTTRRRRPTLVSRR